MLVVACAANPPPRWQQGGAALVMGKARWDPESGDTIEILPNGNVLEDGDLLFVLDRVGRVVDDDGEPIAILLPDGQVAGPDDRYLGRVGLSNASPPGSSSAWLSILPNGQVITFNSDGDRIPAGVWTGCNGPVRRTCTLVTHLVLVRRYASQPRSGVGVGIGIGVGY